MGDGRRRISARQPLQRLQARHHPVGALAEAPQAGLIGRRRGWLGGTDARRTLLQQGGTRTFGQGGGATGLLGRAPRPLGGVEGRCGNRLDRRLGGAGGLQGLVDAALELADEGGAEPSGSSQS